ncbi:MAG: EF-hand domain-containing protein [Planctomycetales bacterium]|nr:EF-hand domain-containing protein [Planctomycetales bacterium]
MRQVVSEASRTTLLRDFGGRRRSITSLAVLLLGVSSGCSGGPSRVSAPEIDPVAASKEAIRLYDKDGDGGLSEDELQACPGIQLHRDAYDADGDKVISQEEIAAQLQKLVETRIGQTSLKINVTLNGRSLPGASITLVPEPYLGDAVKTAYGTTGRAGIAAMDIRDEDLPTSEHGIVGVHVGTYKVEVTHPSVPIAERYNSATTLGYETELGNPGFSINLKK